MDYYSKRWKVFDCLIGNKKIEPKGSHQKKTAIKTQKTVKYFYAFIFLRTYLLSQLMIGFLDGENLFVG